MLAALAAQPGVRLPGARRHEFRARVAANGVEVPLSLIEKLEAFASSG
jgi:LDH2 family malate/lactate/ureidoglycolate dehydrogenase